MYYMDEINSTEDNLESIIKGDDDLLKTENGLIFNPYNPINKYITINSIEQILSKYGIHQNINNYELSDSDKDNLNNFFIKAIDRLSNEKN